MIRKISKYISDNCLLTPGAKVVAGLSGGADSVCLVKVLVALGYDVTAAHCNFHLRGEESMRDELFALALCRQLGIDCMKADFDTQAYATAHSLSIEMAARELRYDFFRQVMRDRQCEAIAVGHHQDDSIETMLLNLVRGTGLRGLCAIQPRNGDIVRPLLCVSRSDIESHLSATGQAYVTDHTNNEDLYARNKVRLNIMPELERINAGARGNLATTIDNLQEVRKVYAAAIQRDKDECCQRLDDGSLRISIPKLVAKPSPLSILHEMLSPMGFNRSQMQGVIKAIGESGRFLSSATHTLLIDRQEIVVWPTESSADFVEVPLSDCSCIDMEIIVIPQDVQDDATVLSIDKSPCHAYIDAGKVKHELTVRTPRRGDTFAPFGMKGRRKLLSDFLTDQKVSMAEKSHQLLVCDGEEIVWVAGRRSSELYRITADTVRAVHLIFHA